MLFEKLCLDLSVMINFCHSTGKTVEVKETKKAQVGGGLGETGVLKKS